jgi:hypothetical protein
MFACCLDSARKEHRLFILKKCQPKTSCKDRKFKYLERLSLQSGGGARAVGCGTETECFRILTSVFDIGGSSGASKGSRGSRERGSSRGARRAEGNLIAPFRDLQI